MSGSRKLVSGFAAVSVAALALVAVPLAPAQAATPQCTNANLHATFHHTDSGAGHRFGRLVLTNVSNHACHTGGYGGLSYVGHGNGTQIGAAATRDAGTVRTLVLSPGQRVVSEVSETVASNFSASTCHPTAVDGFRVYVPNATRSQFIAHRTTGCANASVHLIAHKPFRRP
ncbi:DUF4232 domain-containing protein [Marmoricola sp. URHB0036]|uniref:DUF4232 domain-containing protein n=1 Tax=Marmoricola sp. URHB0036 TaxID=1298863 RepID=UPI00040D6163|nr:DUF4232 domain-containing protein [Marmoricola sp. URHB0036]